MILTSAACSRIASIAACILAAFFACGAASAAEPDRWSAFADPVFRNYGLDNGLPNQVTTAIGEDGDGFMWIGTEGGLARFDGYRFHSYKINSTDLGALPDNWVTTLHTDPLGRLWVGTSSGGIARYDRDRDRFVSYRPGPGGVSNGDIGGICDDGAGGLWIATESGLDHLDAATGRIVALHHRAGSAGSIPDDRVLAVMRDRAGTLWVGTRRGAAKRASGSARFVAVALGSSAAGAIAVGSIFEDKRARIWLGTTSRGAFVFDPRTERARPVTETESSHSGIRSQYVYAIGPGERDEVWLGTYGQGIVAVDLASGRTRRILHRPIASRSLADDTIWALHRDRAGDVWVGTTAGLSRLETSGDAVLSVLEGSGRRTRLSDPDVVSLLAAPDGRVWAGLLGAGIDIIDLARARVTNVPPDRTKPKTALPGAFVLSLAAWSANEMFIGTGFGLYRADAAGKHLARVMVPGRDPEARTHVLAALGPNLWIGGADDGLWGFAPADPSRKPEHFDAGTLTDRRIVSLAPGSSGDLWIGTRDGLNRLDLATRKIERIAPDPGHATSLAAGFISALMLDRTGRLWAGSMGAGIGVLVGRDADDRPRFHRIGVKEGLPDGNVDGLLSDASGRIWVATDGGIAVVDPVSFTVTALSRADGAPVSAYWDHSMTATPSGDLLFGGAGTGITVIVPSRFRVWDYRPPIVVTEARVGGRAVPSGGFNDPAGGGAKMFIRPGANSLAVEFSALDYSAPENNRYAYRLDGFDKDWVYTDSTRRLAAYTNLPPGNYALRLRGSNRNGLWSQSMLSLPIAVLPAWYQTLWFVLLAAACVVGCILALLQARTGYLRRRQHELERQVAERTAELVESKRQIELIAYYDALTSLPNRRQFTADIRKLTALVDRKQGHFALVLIDLDRFKEINDTLGHDAGDALLVEAARRMQLTVRVSDSLTRLGGDEFAMLIGDLPVIFPTDITTIECICKRVIDCFAETIEFNGIAMRSSASIGVALCPENGSNPEEIYKAADVALYEAKRGGRNTWRWHDAQVGLPTGASFRENAADAESGSEDDLPARRPVPAGPVP